MLMALDPGGKGPIWQVTVGDKAFGPFGTGGDMVISFIEITSCP